MRPEDAAVARERVARWPREDRVALVAMTPAEVELLGEAIVLLDVRPEHAPPAPGKRVVEIDLR
jgi:hypothetical protein